MGEHRNPARYSLTIWLGGAGACFSLLRSSSGVFFYRYLDRRRQTKEIGCYYREKGAIRFGSYESIERIYFHCLGYITAARHSAVHLCLQRKLSWAIVISQLDHRCRMLWRGFILARFRFPVNKLTLVWSREGFTSSYSKLPIGHYNKSFGSFSISIFWRFYKE